MKKYILALFLLVLVSPVNTFAETDDECILISRTLKVGSKGGDVADLHRFLSHPDRGYLGLPYQEKPETIEFTATTTRAVRDFQFKNGLILNALSAGAGTVGPLTKAKIASLTGCAPEDIKDLREGNRRIDILSLDEAGKQWRRGQNVALKYKTKNLNGYYANFSLVPIPDNGSRFHLHYEIINTDGPHTFTAQVPLTATSTSGMFNLVVGSRLNSSAPNVVSDTASSTVEIIGNDKFVRQNLPTLTLKKPVTGDVWEKGDKDGYKVEWDKTGGKNLKISVILANLDLNQRWVVREGVSNKGAVKLNASDIANLKPGNYEVRLWSLISANQIIRDVGDTFKIEAKKSNLNKPTIERIIPNTGLSVGDKVKIEGTKFPAKLTKVYMKKIGGSIEQEFPGLNPNSSGKQLQFIIPSRICSTSTNCEDVTVGGIYEIRIGNANGISESHKTIEINSAPPGTPATNAPTVDITATPATINHSSLGSTISWTTTNATSCKILNTNGMLNWVKDYSLPTTTPTGITFSGFALGDTTFRMQCFGPGGNATDTVKVTRTNTTDTATARYFVRNVDVIGDGKVNKASSESKSTVTWESDMGTERPVSVYLVPETTGSPIKLASSNTYNKDKDFDITSAVLLNKNVPANNNYKVRIDITGGDGVVRRSTSTELIQVESTSTAGDDNNNDPSSNNGGGVIPDVPNPSVSNIIIRNETVGQNVKRINKKGYLVGGITTYRQYNVRWNAENYTLNNPEATVRLQYVNSSGVATYYDLKKVAVNRERIDFGGAFLNTGTNPKPVPVGVYTLQIVVNGQVADSLSGVEVVSN